MPILKGKELRYEVFNRWAAQLDWRHTYIPRGRPLAIKVNETETFVSPTKPRSLEDEAKSPEINWPVYNAPKYPARQVMKWYLPAKNGVIEIKNFYENDIFIGTSRKKMTIEKLLKDYERGYEWDLTTWSKRKRKR